MSVRESWCAAERRGDCTFMCCSVVRCVVLDGFMLCCSRVVVCFLLHDEGH